MRFQKEFLRRRINSAIFMLFLIFAGFGTSECPAQEGLWEDLTQGLSDKEFLSISEGYQRDVIFIGTTNGLYKSNHEKDAWQNIFLSHGERKGIKDIQSMANTIYIATGNGLFVSVDGGETWVRKFKGIGPEKNCLSVKLKTINDEMYTYLGTAKGLFLSNDGCKTWNKAPGLIGRARVCDIALSNSSENESLYAICDNELYQITEKLTNYRKIFGSHFIESTDEEFAEEAREETETTSLLRAVSQKEKTIFLATNRGLFMSSDDGNLWSRLGGTGLTDRNIWDVWIVSLKPLNIFVATNRGIIHYRKNEWRNMSGGIDQEKVRKIIATTSGRLWALSRRGVYRLVNRKFLDKITKGDKLFDLFDKFRHEPTANETMSMAIEYAEVNPEKIQNWRRGAKMKALLPRVDFEIDHGWSDTYEIYTNSSTSYWTDGPRDRTEGWDLRFSWDLSDLIWNEYQTSIDVRSKLMVQLRDDILDEITRIYFERRRLQIETLTRPEKSLNEQIKTTLRIDELTASLDALTGSRFSQKIKENDAESTEKNAI